MDVGHYVHAWEPEIIAEEIDDFINSNLDCKEFEMKINVQRQAGVNSKHLKEFVAKVYSKHEDLERNFIMSMNSKMNKGIFSIEDENGLAVVATTHQSTWHPHCVYVRLAYDFNRVNDVCASIND